MSYKVLVENSLVGEVNTLGEGRDLAYKMAFQMGYGNKSGTVKYSMIDSTTGWTCLNGTLTGIPPNGRG